ncbi:MAG: hypothetical protein ACREPM_14635, partial [Gemmatimonadaceae bacterium]
VVPVANPDALAAAIVATIDGSTGHVGRVVKERACNLFSLRRMADAYERLYRADDIPGDLKWAPTSAAG